MKETEVPEIEIEIESQRMTKNEVYKARKDGIRTRYSFCIIGLGNAHDNLELLIKTTPLLSFFLHIRPCYASYDFLLSFYPLL